MSGNTEDNTLSRVSKDRVILSEHPALRNCTRMSLLGHMILLMLSGIIIGYSLVVSPIDRNELKIAIDELYESNSRLVHASNSTNRFWMVIDDETVDASFNKYEIRCFPVTNRGDEEGKKLNQSSLLIHDDMVPFLTHFEGITQSLYIINSLDFRYPKEAIQERVSNEMQNVLNGNIFRTQLSVNYTRSDYIRIVSEPPRTNGASITYDTCYFAFLMEKRRKKN